VLNSFDLTVVPPACYTKGIVSKLMMMNPFERVYETKRNETNKDGDKL